MKEQKFVHGDVVRLSKRSEEAREYGDKAIVIESNAESHGDLTEDEHEYTLLFLRDVERVSWFDERLLTKIGTMTPRKMLRLELEKAKKDFAEDVAEMKLEGLEPVPGQARTWKRIE